MRPPRGVCLPEVLGKGTGITKLDKVSVGQKVKITNGYVNEWQGKAQLTLGKFGKTEIV